MTFERIVVNCKHKDVLWCCLDVESVHDDDEWFVWCGPVRCRAHGGVRGRTTRCATGADGAIWCLMAYPACVCTSRPSHSRSAVDRWPAVSERASASGGRRRRSIAARGRRPSLPACTFT